MATAVDVSNADEFEVRKLDARNITFCGHEDDPDALASSSPISCSRLNVRILPVIMIAALCRAMTASHARPSRRMGFGDGAITRRRRCCGVYPHRNGSCCSGRALQAERVEYWRPVWNTWPISTLRLKFQRGRKPSWAHVAMTYPASSHGAVGLGNRGRGAHQIVVTTIPLVGAGEPCEPRHARRSAQCVTGFLTRLPGLFPSRTRAGRYRSDVAL